jgi:hypothetical protein
MSLLAWRHNEWYHYLNMFDNFVLPIVSKWDSYEKLHFMHDGVPLDFALHIHAWLDSHFFW